MNKECWMLRHAQAPRLVVRRTAAVGDVIACTVVADKIRSKGFDCVFQAAPAIAHLLAYCPSVNVIDDTSVTPDINLDGVYENHPERTTRHFSDLFLTSANIQLQTRQLDLGPPTNCRATLHITTEEQAPTRKRLEQHARPWVFVCPKSNSWANRTIPDYIWVEVAKLVHGTCFWIGTSDAPLGFVDLHIRDLVLLLRWLSCADLLVSVDTGPLHLAAALGVPCVALEQASSPELHLSDQRDFISIRHPTLECLNCQKNICPKAAHLPPCQVWSPEYIAQAVNRRLQAQLGNDIAAVIPIYQPPLDRLQQCLDNVIPQVSEVIVTRDAGGRVPPGLAAHPKVRHVQHRMSDLGFGKNVNFGVRHTNSKCVLILNDDVFLWGGAVEALKACLLPDVGIVGHQLWYADGTIQHGGKYRKPGMRGWGHIDHRSRKPSIRVPMECENVTAASILVPRQAFYAAHGFDEDFFMYAEDDAFCLQMRQAGYKVVYTPLAKATHLESQSAGAKRHKLHELIEPSNKLFDAKWGWWIEQNLHRVPGVFV